MESRSNVSFFVFLAFLVLSLFLSRGNKKKQPLAKPALPKVAVKKPAMVKQHSHEKMSMKKSSVPYKTARDAPSYEVHRKKVFTPLSKGWNNKKSLKQAFILSEVLRRTDERERKF